MPDSHENQIDRSARERFRYHVCRRAGDYAITVDNFTNLTESDFIFA